MAKLCLYILTEWGIMSFICGMIFQCGSTVVKVPQLQAGAFMTYFGSLDNKVVLHMTAIDGKYLQLI